MKTYIALLIVSVILVLIGTFLKLNHMELDISKIFLILGLLLEFVGIGGIIHELIKKSY